MNMATDQKENTFHNIKEFQMSEAAEMVEVKEGYYEKLGSIHCGVIRGYKISCGPQHLKVLNDGDSHTFDMTGISAERKGEVVTFTK